MGAEGPEWTEETEATEEMGETEETEEAEEKGATEEAGGRNYIRQIPPLRLLCLCAEDPEAAPAPC